VIVDPVLARGRFDRDTLPLLQQEVAYQNAGIRVVRIAFPVIEVALWWRAINGELLLHVQADDYDYLPVQGWWTDGTGQPAHQGGSIRLPGGLGFQLGGDPYGQNRTWFCFPGWREFHDHPGHQNTPCIHYRFQPAYRLPGLIVQLQSDLNRPQVGVT